MTQPGLPAGIGLSRVHVYESQAPDSQCGGSPHVHLACTEMYVVLGGHGAAEFLSPSGFERAELSPGSALHFAPGTLHRLVSTPGDGLHVLVIMENGHLNERGDAVFTFPPHDLADPERYAALAAATDDEALRARRDRAVLGFNRLAALWRDDPAAGRRELRAFYEHAGALVRGPAAHWPQMVADGPATAVEQLAARTRAIAAGDITHLMDATVTTLPHPRDEEMYGGLCGRVWPYRSTSLPASAATTHLP